ncbi:MAG: hypothetical protein QOI38_2792 [Sphingomonadales bacterium]|jgi:hypothetical protein|nr:hypothetical protein [Sphingomonadales bacterium]
MSGDEQVGSEAGETAPRAAGTAAGERLVAAVEDILGSTMGTVLLARRSAAGPLRRDISGWLAGYAIVWLVLAQLGPRDPRLVGLLVWGALYFAGALYFSRRSVGEVYATIREDILPFVSPDYAEAVADDLRRHYPPLFRFGVPLLIAAVSLAAAAWALASDLRPDSGGLVAETGSRDPALPHLRAALGGEMLFWAGTYFVYFLTAAQAVIAARFYLAFARNLEIESANLHLLGAADSPAVRGLSRLGTQVLIFWVMIFLSILAVMLVAVLPPAPYRLPPDSKLLFTMVPVAGFFSLGFGTLVYLAAEAKIRATLQRFASRGIDAIQQRANALMRDGAGPAEQCGEAARLADLQQRIVAGARYGSRVGVSVSVALPLIMPVVSILVNLLTE